MVQFQAWLGHLEKELASGGAGRPGRTCSPGSEGPGVGHLQPGDQEESEATRLEGQ